MVDRAPGAIRVPPVAVDQVAVAQAVVDPVGADLGEGLPQVGLVAAIVARVPISRN